MSVTSDASSDIAAIEPEVVGQQLTEVEKSTGLAEDSALALRGQFADYYTEIVTWRSKVAMITDETDPVQQKAAREIRLGLKDVRCNVERLRKTLKEDSLKRGKAIDGFANVLKYLCEPVEQKLLDVEQYAERQEAARIAALVEHRTHELTCVGANPAAYNLGQMDEATWLTILDSETKAFEAREAALLKAQQEKEAKEKAEKEEQERVRLENERLKAEAEEREAELAKEREAKEKAEAEAKEAQRKEEERIAAEKKAAEDKAKAEKKAKDKARRAPDKEKLLAFASALAEVCAPEMKTTEGKNILRHALNEQQRLSCWIEREAEAL